VANTQAQFGFKHVGYLGGGAPDYQLQSFTIASAYATNIGFGDPVTFTSSPAGTLIQASVALATTQPIVGVFQGCMLIPSTGGAPTWSPYWPGASAQNATGYVITAPNALFLAASFSTSIGTADIGKNVNFSTGAPNTTGGGFSIATIDQSTLTSGLGTAFGNQPFKIYSLYQGVGNGSDPTTNYGWAVVSFNFQMNRSGTHI
jgi:hypothetical protein